MNDIEKEQLSKIKSYCIKCDEKTPSIEPIEIMKTSVGKPGLRTTCSKCGKNKFRPISKKIIKRLPENFREKIYKMENSIPWKKEGGGIFPELIPIISSLYPDDNEDENKSKTNEGSGLPVENQKKKSKSLEEKIEKAIKLLKDNGYKIEDPTYEFSASEDESDDEQ
jgi:predicted  nucleic acid-binding Zn-ribbon protein